MLTKLKEYVHHLGLTDATPEARKTFFGVVLVKFGTGAIGIWGIISIYFFSYYRQYDDSLRMSQFSFLITFAALPMSIITIFSIQIARRVGFKKLIRTAMIISPFSMMIGSTQKDFYTFALFNTFIASLCFGSTVMPLLYCLWSHFPKKTGNATGIALTSFGLAAFFYSLVATFIVNPENQPAEIPYTEGSQTYFLFDKGVADNVPNMTFWMGFIQMLFCVPGCFMVSLNTEQEKIDLPHANMNSLNNGGDNSVEMQPITGQTLIQQKQQPLTLMQAAKSTPFLIIYFSTFLLSCFSLFISINFKTYGLTKINDDYFLTFLITTCTLTSSLSNLLWGYLVDKYNFRFIYLIVISIIFVAGFLFPYLTAYKLGFFLVYQALGASERGLYTIIGPGLVQIFGIKLGAELFPIKSTSFFLALVFLPLIQMGFLQFFDFDQTTHLLLIGIAFAYWLSLKLKVKYDFVQ